MKVKSFIAGAAVLAVLLTGSYFIGGSNNVIPLDENHAAQVRADDAALDAGAEAGAKTRAIAEAEAGDGDGTRADTQATARTGTEAKEEAQAETEAEAQAKAEAEAGAPAINDGQQPERRQDSEAQSPDPDKPSPSAAQEAIVEDEAAAEGQTDEKSVSEKDQYLTDPVPDGKPQPIEWQQAAVDKQKAYTASLSVTAKTILNNLHLFNEDKLEVLPSDGVIYANATVAFYDGESVFDVLLREMKNNRIHMEFVMTPIYNSHYIEGINNIYEFDCGELSGWMYKVNGWFPNYGASRYQLEPDDQIEWIYTCDLGRDIGGYSANGG